MSLGIAAGIAGILHLFAASMQQDPDLRLTRSGFEVGLGLAQYHYQEPNFPVTAGGTLPMRETGAALYLDGSFTLRTAEHHFASLEVHTSSLPLLDWNSMHYAGTGNSQDIYREYALDARIIMGKDLIVGERSALTPYFGFGFRNMENDSTLNGLGDETPVGFDGTRRAFAFERSSEYWYVPLGIRGHFILKAPWVLAPSMEYDLLIHGSQIRRLNDTGIAGSHDVAGPQNKGYGFRMACLVERGHFAAGPWYSVWSMKSAESVSGSSDPTTTLPANTTRELGLECRYRF